MMPPNHGGRFDHGRHLLLILLDAARHGKTWQDDLKESPLIWMNPEKSVNLLLGEVLPSNRYFPTSMIVGRKEARRPSFVTKLDTAPQKLRD